MEHFGSSRRLTRREMLRIMGVTAGALAAAPVVAACAPAPAGEGAPAAADGGATSLELWTFVNTHARWYESMAESYKEEVNPDFELTVNEIAYGEMHDKLLIALQSGGVGAPDISDIEQGRFGGFLRGGDPGLVNLADQLRDGGFLEDLVAARLALYSYQGAIYGIEHALTPVVLYYRQDVWGDVGVDFSTVETWDDYINVATQVSSEDVSAMPFPLHEVVLRQRGSDYFNADGEVTIDSNESIATMEWILAMRDEYGIASQDPEGDAWWAAVKEGRFLSRVGADWYAGFFRDNAPEMSGQWQAVLLPAFEPGGIRTSCHGGTGACIVQTSPNAEAAWDFLQYSMLSVEGNVRRFEMTNLFPPYLPAMEDERLHGPSEYFNGQDLGELFATAAPDVPSQYQSPFRAELNTLMTAGLQDLYDNVRTPADLFTEIADSIRESMADA